MAQLWRHVLGCSRYHSPRCVWNLHIWNQSHISQETTGYSNGHPMSAGQYWFMFGYVGIKVGGGKVTRFPLGPLNVFVYISHWAGKLSKQAALWRRLSELVVIARAAGCDSPVSKSNKHDKILMQNWNVILLNLISFLDWVAPAEIILYGCYWDPERRVPWG